MFSERIVGTFSMDFIFVGIKYLQVQNRKVTTYSLNSTKESRRQVSHHRWMDHPVHLAQNLDRFQITIIMIISDNKVCYWKGPFRAWHVVQWTCFTRVKERNNFIPYIIIDIHHLKVCRCVILTGCLFRCATISQ